MSEELYTAEQVEQIRREAVEYGKNWADVVHRAVQAGSAERYRKLEDERDKLAEEVADLRAALSRQSSAAPEAAVEVTRLDIMSMIRAQCHRVYASAIDREEIDTKYMREIEDALKAVYSSAELASRCHAEGGNTSETGGRGNDIKSSETRMDTAFDGGRAAPALADAPQAELLEAARAAVTHAIDYVRHEVHVCDRDNDDLAVRACSAEIQALHAAIKSATAQPVEQT